MIQLNFGGYLAQIWDAFKSVAIPAALAVFISYLIRPMYRRMVNKGLSKSLSALLSMLVFGLIFGGFMTLVVVMVTLQIKELAQSGLSIANIDLSWVFGLMPDDLVAAITNTSGQLDLMKTFDYLVETGQINLSANIFTTTVNSVVGIIYWLIVIIMMPVFLFFFFKRRGYYC